MHLLKMNLKFLLIYFVLRPISGSYHEQYRIPHELSDKWESYIFNEKEYIVQNLPARWEDALIICRGRHNGSLAVLDNIDKADFLAEALSESQFSIDSVWVGARRQSAEDPLGYRWVGETRVELQRTSNDIMDSSMGWIDDSHYPHWLNRTHVPVPESGADCVAFKRMFHDKPVFVDLPCEVDRPFVCEKPAETQLHVVELKTVRCKTGLYHVYDGKLTWDQAAAYCVLGKMSLAHIANMKCLKKLGITMLKARPSIETAWIGARGVLGKWTWVDDGLNIFHTSGVHEGTTEDWPPLRDRSTLKQNGCMQLDRHKAQTPIFLEARCERKMQFICYESREASLRKSVEAPSDDLYTYILVRQKLFWSHAYNNCLKMNGFLARVDNEEVITQLLLLMGENKDMPIGHIWVSGRLNMTRDVLLDVVTNSWYNPATGDKIPDPRNAHHGVFVPPWLDDEFTTDNSCLNLDRENHLSGLVYGLPCDTPQYSICMIEKPTRSIVKIHPHTPTSNVSEVPTSTGASHDSPETFLNVAEINE